MKDDLNLIKDIERYLEGEMSEQERSAFDALRRKDPVVDAEVARHQLFLQQFSDYGRRQQLQDNLQRIHSAIDMDRLREAVSPAATALPVSGRLVSFRRRVFTGVAAAACIAIVSSLGTIAWTQHYARHNTNAQYEDVRRVLNTIQRSQNAIINDINSKNHAPLNPGNYGGTGFAISSKGYLVTNYHVIKGADSLYVQNSKGEFFKAITVMEDNTSDLAVLKIADSTFKGQPLPYSIQPQKVKLGEEVFTLGYPRDEIVYGKGYISAQTGFNGDTVAYQVSIPVNPGNSGGPLINNKGEVVGIISGKQTTADGIAFAVKSGNLKRLLEKIPKDKVSRKEWSNHNHLESLERQDQIAKLEDYVYMVKVYNSH